MPLIFKKKAYLKKKNEIIHQYFKVTKVKIILAKIQLKNEDANFYFYVFKKKDCQKRPSYHIILLLKLKRITSEIL